MSRTILTTCGTSLFTSSCWGDPFYLNKEPLSKSDIYSDPQRYRKKQAQCEAITRIAQKNDPSGDSLANSFDGASWDGLNRLRDLPAELASLRVIIEALKSKDEALNNGDRIILLHSDNDDGKFCAKVIEKVLKELLSDVNEIVRDQISGLDPKDPKQLLTALLNIWTKYRDEVRSNDLEFIFNLTGGYKATSMILAAQAALLSVSANITVTYLHEDASPDILFRTHWNNNSPQFGFWSINNSDNNSSSLDGL